MTNFIKRASGIVLFASLLLSPAFAFAEGGHTNNRDTEHPKAHGNSAFAHTHARGYDKDRGDDRGEREEREGGRGHTATTTPQTTTLSLRGIAINNISTSSATVRWTTNVTSSSKVYFGTSAPLNLLTASSVSSAALVKNHSLGLTGLTASTTYYVIVQSTNASSTVTSSQTSFTTTALPVTNQVTLTSAVVATHNAQNNCWMIIGNNVYNVTTYIPNHPGGVAAIVGLCGADATSAFGGVGHSNSAQTLLASYLLGALGQTITI